MPLWRIPLINHLDKVAKVLLERTQMVLHSLSRLFFDFLEVDGTQDRRLGLYIHIHQKLDPFVGKRGLGSHSIVSVVYGLQARCEGVAREGVSETVHRWTQLEVKGDI